MRNAAARLDDMHTTLSAGIGVAIPACPARVTVGDDVHIASVGSTRLGSVARPVVQSCATDR
jgi:hypothetical protein